MATTLTALAVKKMKARPSAFYTSDTAVRGLQLRTAPDGSQSWSLRYRINGRQRRYTIGDAAVIPLGDDKPRKITGARTLAREALYQAAHGTDPAERKQQRRTEKTVADVCALFLVWAEAHKDSWKEDRRRVRTHLLPAWKHRPMTAITRGDVRDLVKAIAIDTPVEANRVHALISKMMTFAVDEEILVVNPVARMKKLQKETSRDRVISPDDIRRFWAHTETWDAPMRALWRLRLVTLQRLSEVSNATWGEFNVDTRTWEIPKERRKNKVAHLIPLSPLAVQILTALRTPETTSTDYVVAGARGKRQQAEAAATLGIADFRGHDLRRTGASRMPGVSRFIKARVLGHIDKSVTGIYDRYEYQDEKRIALDAWARTLTSILEQQDTNVVAFGRR